MTDAYVNVLVDSGAVSNATDSIAEVDEVSQVHMITGEYDIIAQVEVDDKNELPEVVADKIHDVSGVIDTVTNVAFEP